MATESSLPAASNLSSASLYDPLQGFPDEVKTSAYAELGALTFSELYTRMLGAASDQTVAIDGVALSGARTQLIAARSAILAYGTSYPHVAGLWQIKGNNPQDWSYDQFRTALFAGSSKAGLGLTDDQAVGAASYCNAWDDYLTGYLGVNIQTLTRATQAVRSYCGGLEKASQQTSYSQFVAQAANRPVVDVVSKCAEPANSATIVLGWGGPNAPTYTDHGVYDHYCGEGHSGTDFGPYDTPPATFSQDPQFWTRNGGGGMQVPAGTN